MGSETVKAVLNEPELELVGMADIRSRGESIGYIIGDSQLDMIIENDAEKLIELTRPALIIDFTSPQSVFDSIRSFLKNGGFMCGGDHRSERCRVETA